MEYGSASNEILWSISKLFCALTYVALTLFLLQEHSRLAMVEWYSASGLGAVFVYRKIQGKGRIEVCSLWGVCMV